MAALEWKNLHVVGSDISREFVDCAVKNAETLKVVDRVKFSVRDLADFKENTPSVDIIAVNPPYGIAVQTHGETSKLYDLLFEKAFKILSDGGRLAVITPHPNIVERLASKWTFKVKSAWRICEGELPRAIQIILKK
jgi:23S rRNA G2445 N2-methylase RlmL